MGARGSLQTYPPQDRPLTTLKELRPFTFLQSIAFGDLQKVRGPGTKLSRRKGRRVSEDSLGWREGAMPDLTGRGPGPGRVALDAWPWPWPCTLSPYLAVHSLRCLPGFSPFAPTKPRCLCLFLAHARPNIFGQSLACPNKTAPAVGGQGPRWWGPQCRTQQCARTRVQ